MRWIVDKKVVEVQQLAVELKSNLAYQIYYNIRADALGEGAESMLNTGKEVSKSPANNTHSFV